MADMALWGGGATVGPVLAEGAGLLETLGIYPGLVLANVVAFILVFLVLKKLMFERVRRHMDARDEELRLARAEAAERARERDAAVAALAEAKKQVEREAYERTQEQVRAGVGRKAEMIQRAQEQALEKVEEARAAAATDRDRTIASGADAIIDMARLIVARAADETVEPDAVEGAIRAAVDGGIAGRSAS